MLSMICHHLYGGGVTLTYDEDCRRCKEKKQLGEAQQKLPAGPRVKRPARAVKA